MHKTNTPASEYSDYMEQYDEGDEISGMFTEHSGLDDEENEENEDLLFEQEEDDANAGDAKPEEPEDKDKDSEPDQGYELTEEDIVNDDELTDLEGELCAEEYTARGVGYTEYTIQEWDHILKVYRTHDKTHPEWEKVNMAIYNAMYPFCKYVAARYYRTYMPKYGEDLINEGYEGMLKALNTYDPRKGAPTTWCFREIIHADRDLIDLMAHNTTPHFQSNIQRIQRLVAKKESNGIPWDVDDLAIELNLSPTTIEGCLSILDRNKNQVSVEEPIGDTEVKLTDRLVSDYPDPLHVALDSEKHEAIMNAIMSLKDPQQIIAVYFSFGFDGDDPMSAPEIAKASKRFRNIKPIKQQDVRKLLNDARVNIQRELVKAHTIDDDIRQRSMSKINKRSSSFHKSEKEFLEEWASFDFSSFDGI